MSNVAGVYERKTSLNTMDINKHRKLLNWFKRYYSRYGHEDLYPPATRRILEALQDLSFVPAFLLAHCCCRYSELNQIHFRHIQLFSGIEIRSTKSDNIKYVPALHRYDARYLSGLSSNTKIQIVTYDQLKLDLKQAIKSAKIPKVKGILDSTHIFRHIAASDMFDRGCDLSSISDRLGHDSNDTSKKYIHKGKY